MNIYFLIGIILFLAIVVFILLDVFVRKNGLLIPIVLILMVFILADLSCYLRAKEIDKLNAMKTNPSIEWYLDGESVDANNIEVSYYRYTVSKDGTKVFLTKPVYRDR